MTRTASTQIGRIRNPEAYESSQPDLDVYAPCFEGITSPRFAGSDVDGVFAVHSHWFGELHGVWERRSSFLLLEHKTSPACWASSRGQWVALNGLATVGRRCGIHVIATYGPNPDGPETYQVFPVPGWESATPEGLESMTVSEMDWDNLDNHPVRRWVVKATRRETR